MTICIFSLSNVGFSQEYTQSIRGKAIDKETLASLPGVIIELNSIEDDQVIAVALSDENGDYFLSDLPIGQVRLTARIAFYTPLIVEDIQLSSAKEVVLDLLLEASNITLESVEISANPMRGQAINPMAALSAYTITPEQTKQFAGSWDDPMRVLTAFPGVIQQGGGFNDFTVRGNSGANMLYRLEGVPIHNPNHFSILGNSGGFVTQFSTELLSNSDFFSSAFPAEFGNVVNGVFDFRFRHGNDEHREHTFKASIFGLDFATEGPFSKKSKASYIVNYRYSTLGLLANIIDVGGVRPGYQDLSFNLNFPLKNNGVVKIFGVGGSGNLLLEAERDSSMWDEDARRVERNWGSNSGSVGAAYYQPLKKDAYFHAAASVSNGEYFDDSKFIDDDLSEYDTQISNLTEMRINVAADYNRKFSNKHYNKTGFIINHVDHMYNGALFNKQKDGLDTLAFTSGASQYIQMFTQSKFSLTQNLDLSGGLHYMYFALNGKSSIDPRLALIYKHDYNSSMSISYGHHSRVESMPFYFVESLGDDGQTTLPNKDLNFFKAHHLVANYTRMLNKSLKFSMELYYQYMYDVPAEINGSYSVQNAYQTIPVVALDNVGEGRNYGFEVMLQQFTKNDFYYMISGSVFDAAYKAGDDVWRSAQFDQNYSYNILIGKEFQRKPKKNKQRSLGLNLHWRHAGGTYYNPIDLEASELYGSTRYDLSDPYSLRNPALYNLDFKITRRISRPKYASELSLSIKNLYTSRSVIDRSYDPDINAVKETTDYGVIPNIAYKISF